MSQKLFILQYKNYLAWVYCWKIGKSIGDKSCHRPRPTWKNSSCQMAISKNEKVTATPLVNFTSKQQAFWKIFANWEYQVIFTIHLADFQWTRLRKTSWLRGTGCKEGRKLVKVGIDWGDWWADHCADRNAVGTRTRSQLNKLPCLFIFKLSCTS